MRGLKPMYKLWCSVGMLEEVRDSGPLSRVVGEEAAALQAAFASVDLISQPTIKTTTAVLKMKVVVAGRSGGTAGGSGTAVAAGCRCRGDCGERCPCVRAGDSC